MGNRQKWETIWYKKHIFSTGNKKQENTGTIRYNKHHCQQAMGKITRNIGTRMLYDIEKCKSRKIWSFGKCWKQYSETISISSRMLRNDDLRASPLYRPNPRARELKFWDDVHSTPRVTCQMLSVIFLFLFFLLNFNLVWWGFVINGATPSSLLYMPLLVIIQIQYSQYCSLAHLSSYRVRCLAKSGSTSQPARAREQLTVQQTGEGCHAVL